MKKSFVEIHSNLKDSVILAIRLAVLKSKTKSKFISENTINVMNEYPYTLLDGYLTEIAHNYIMDDNGYQYNFSVLSLDQLCELADYCNTLK
jgi:hypothetical protein